MVPALFSTVGEVLVTVAQRPDGRVRDIALSLGISERTVISALRTLEDMGVITVQRHGRRNRYVIHPAAVVRVGDSTMKVGRLLDALVVKGDATRGGPERRAARAG